MMKDLITFIALPAIISLSNAAHFSCARETPYGNPLLSENAQQQLCAMYSNNLADIPGAPLPDKEEFAQPITNDNELPNDDDDDLKHDAVWPGETSPECGYYDGLGRRISEHEYHLELDYEIEHGVPYPAHLRPEAGSLSLHAYSDAQCGGDAIGDITQPDFCYPVTKAEGVSVSSLPKNCEVTGFIDEACEGKPVEVVPLGSTEAGCHAPTAAAAVKTFGSVLVECEPLVG